MRLDIEITDEKRITLKSREGLEKVFLMRPYKPGDEVGIKEIVMEEYGQSYFKKDFYNLEWIKRNALSDKYRFFVSEADGIVVGLEIFHVFADAEDYLEPASQILLKDYRSYGLAAAMVDYTFEIAMKMEPSALFVHAVTFHISTQHVCGEYGMIPTGFRLGSFMTEKMHNSYALGKCDKYSEGIMIYPVAKKNAGILYIPDEVGSFADKIYGRLGVEYDMADVPHAEEIKAIRESMSAESRMDIKRDSDQRMVTVNVLKEGADIPSKMQEIIDSFEDKPYWVIQISLCTSSKGVYCLYDDLKKIGFFFAGLKPLCGDCERMYMQWIGGTNLNMAEYALTDGFKEIRQDIECFMRQGEKDE
ncbi:MAG: hypothetical protein K5868_04595 [Lachnospiraceae bacterium]|nr:hypothetical protein [Lachnospiraceae bacterium]